jgi:hypothetical protein
VLPSHHALSHSMQFSHCVESQKNAQCT